MCDIITSLRCILDVLDKKKYPSKKKSTKSKKARAKKKNIKYRNNRPKNEINVPKKTYIERRSISVQTSPAILLDDSQFLEDLEYYYVIPSKNRISLLKINKIRHFFDIWRQKHLKIKRLKIDNRVVCHIKNNYEPDMWFDPILFDQIHNKRNKDEFDENENSNICTNQKLISMSVEDTDFSKFDIYNEELSQNYQNINDKEIEINEKHKEKDENKNMIKNKNKKMKKEKPTDDNEHFLDCSEILFNESASLFDLIVRTSSSNSSYAYD